MKTRDLEDIRGSEYFDPQWYVATYPDAQALEDPAAHYLTFGATLKRSPSAQFDSQDYLRRYPDVKHMDPLIHFIRHGAAEGRSPSSVAQGAESRSQVEADEAVAARNWTRALGNWLQIQQCTENQALLGRARLNASVLRRLLTLSQYHELIERYQRVFAARQGIEPRVTVFSAIVGGYDSVKVPEFLDPRLAYILFSDEPEIDTGVWQNKRIPYAHSDKTRIARYVKTHPHELLVDCDIAIWLDSNVALIDDIYPLVDRFVESELAVGAVPHPERDSIYAEFEACAEASKDDMEVMQRQIDKYQASGFEHTDLIESTLMMFNLGHPRIADFLGTWWHEIDQYSRRDQLSLNYSLAHNDLEWFRLTQRPVSPRNHPAFAFGSHSAHDDGMTLILNRALGQLRGRGTQPASLDRERMRIVQFTPSVTANPFYTILPNALSELGYRVEFNTEFDSIDVPEHDDTVFLNLHQLEPFYHRANKDETWDAAKNLLQTLADITEKGVKLVLFWHNPYPHDRVYVDIDERLYKRIGSLCTAAIVLVNAARPFVEQFVDGDKIFYLPHPSYVSAYGAPVNRREARRALGLDDDAFVFLSLGHIKPYKGHDFLLDAWRLRGDEHDSPRSILCIAGRVHNEPLADRIAAEQDVILHAGYLDDDKLLTHIAAADIAIFGHEEIWASGAAILAMSYGLPVIMPRTQYTSEYVRHNDNGFLYQPDDAQDCARILGEARACPHLEHMRFVNLAHAANNDAHATAEKLARIYRRLA